MDEARHLYDQIAKRTAGSIYIGVVGPVRTGKSTFIKRFMEQLVLPHLENTYQRDRARDELPQSGSGRTIMTTEPKFVPEQAVEISPDGSFTYTPAQNKVGKDIFTYTATDSAGNVSNAASVTVKIVKPTDRAMYQDLSGDSLAYTAMWLKDKGVYTGKRIAGNLCFEPESTLTRGEFLVMAMKLLGAEPESTRLTSGFADENQTPAWMRPYIVSAFKSGMISGVTSPGGMVFRPESNLTRAEAAVMLQNILQLPQPQETAVFAESSAVPVWAQASVSALSEAGITIPVTTSAENLTRREAAELLFECWTLCQARETAASRLSK